MTPQQKKLGAAVGAISLAAVAMLVLRSPSPGPQAAPPPATAAPAQPSELETIQSGLRELLAGYRKIIVLLADETTLSKRELDEANRVGQGLFHDNQARLAQLEKRLAALVGSNAPARLDQLGAILAWIESDPSLYDADRLAFRELLQSLLAVVARDSSLPAIKVHKRIAEDLEAMAWSVIWWS